MLYARIDLTPALLSWVSVMPLQFFKLRKSGLKNGKVSGTHEAHTKQFLLNSFQRPLSSPQASRTPTRGRSLGPRTGHRHSLFGADRRRRRHCTVCQTPVRP